LTNKKDCRERVGLRRGSVDGGSSELLTRLALFNNEIRIEKFLIPAPRFGITGLTDALIIHLKGDFRPNSA